MSDTELNNRNTTKMVAEATRAIHQKIAATQPVHLQTGLCVSEGVGEGGGWHKASGWGGGGVEIRPTLKTKILHPLFRSGQIKFDQGPARDTPLPEMTLVGTAHCTPC